jgi:hypothetical protein
MWAIIILQSILSLFFQIKNKNIRNLKVKFIQKIKIKDIFFHNQSEKNGLILNGLIF